MGEMIESLEGGETGQEERKPGAVGIRGFIPRQWAPRRRQNMDKPQEMGYEGHEEHGGRRRAVLFCGRCRVQLRA